MKTLPLFPTKKEFLSRCFLIGPELLTISQKEFIGWIGKIKVVCLGPPQRFDLFFYLNTSLASSFYRFPLNQFGAAILLPHLVVFLNASSASFLIPSISSKPMQSLIVSKFQIPVSPFLDFLFEFELRMPEWELNSNRIFGIRYH